MLGLRVEFLKNAKSRDIWYSLGLGSLTLDNVLCSTVILDFSTLYPVQYVHYNI